MRNGVVVLFISRSHESQVQLLVFGLPRCRLCVDVLVVCACGEAHTSRGNSAVAPLKNCWRRVA